MAAHAVTVSPNLHLILQAIGRALNLGRPLRVLRCGVIVANEAEDDDQERNQSDEADRTQRSAAGPWQGPARGEGAADRSRPSGALLQAGVRSLRDDLEESLPDLRVSYPGTRIWDDENGLWVVAPSFPLGCDGPQAVLVAGLPYDPVPKRRCWGYWWQGRRPRWIGPRHTNFPDGSICAYADDGEAWQPPDGLTALFDVYSVWLACQLHLRVFGRWPGRQHSVNSYYRLHEFRRGELCSCDSGRSYFDCHRPLDLLENQERAKQEFEAFAGCALADRRDSRSVRRFVESGFLESPLLLSALS